MEVIDNSTDFKEREHKITIARPDVDFDDPMPLGSYLLVKQNASETFYRGTRFLIPDSAQQSPNEGVVVAVGPELEAQEKDGVLIPGAVKPGDMVVFGIYNAEPVTVGDELYQLVSLHDIKLVKRVRYVAQPN